MRESIDTGTTKAWHDWQQDGQGGHKCRDCGIKFSDYKTKYRVCNVEAPTGATQGTEAPKTSLEGIVLSSSPRLAGNEKPFSITQRPYPRTHSRGCEPWWNAPNHNKGGKMSQTQQIEVFTPILDRLLVQLDKPEQRTQGGIIIPDTAQNAPQRGIVIAAGSGGLAEDGSTMPMFVKAGDKILFAKYSGTEVKINGVDYLIISQRDVLGHVSFTNVDALNAEPAVR